MKRTVTVVFEFETSARTEKHFTNEYLEIVIIKAIHSLSRRLPFKNEVKGIFFTQKKE